MSFSGLLAAVAFALASVLLISGPAWARGASFVSDNCSSFTFGSPTSSYTRARATSYAIVAVQEGYQWGGGCWNDNNRDDSPNDPPSTLGTGGEGPDCSGLVFKTWAENDNEAIGGFYLWGKANFIHGHYITSDYKAGAGAPNAAISKTNLIPMDAVASSTHMALYYGTMQDGTDLFIEAKGEAYGTNVWVRTYRGDYRYGGVRRVGWTG